MSDLINHLLGTEIAPSRRGKSLKRQLANMFPALKNEPMILLFAYLGAKVKVCPLQRRTAPPQHAPSLAPFGESLVTPQFKLFHLKHVFNIQL